jgi:hypothetical protein
MILRFGGISKRPRGKNFHTHYLHLTPPLCHVKLPTHSQIRGACRNCRDPPALVFVHCSLSAILRFQYAPGIRKFQSGRTVECNRCRFNMSEQPSLIPLVEVTAITGTVSAINRSVCASALAVGPTWLSIRTIAAGLAFLGSVWATSKIPVHANWT